MRDNVLLRFVARFGVIFVVLIASWFMLAPFYNAVILSSANLVLSTDDPLIASVAQAQSHWYAYSVNGSQREPIYQFDTYGTFFNIVVLLSLILAAPRLKWAGQLWRSTAAVLVLGVVHTLFITVQVKAQFINIGLITVSNQAAYELNWIAVFLGTLGEQLLPLLIAGALTWKAWHSEFAPLLQREPQHKNMACSCGSGKKHKNCCGRQKESSNLIPQSRLKPGA
jgi:hypothetical protein